MAGQRVGTRRSGQGVVATAGPTPWSTRVLRPSRSLAEGAGRPVAPTSATALGRIAAIVVIALVPVGATACGSHDPRIGTVRPIERELESTTTVGRPSGPTSARPDPAPPPSEPTADRTDREESPPPTPQPVGDPALRAEVNALLVRYDEALTRMAADPAGTLDTTSAVSVAWRAVVSPASLLASDVRDDIVDRYRTEGYAVRPPDGHNLSYVHHALEVTAGTDGSLGFTWCGWSPGIGIHVPSGDVVDDSVAHSHGTGRAVLPGASGGARVLTSLDVTDLNLLDPGSPDPCASELEGSP